MYEVVVLAERALAEVDARTLSDLYREFPDPIHLHLLLPVDEGPGRIEAVLSALSAGRTFPGAGMPPVRAEALPADDNRADIEQEAQAELARSLNRLRHEGLDADGETVPHEPLDALKSVVETRGSNEVVIMTRTHVVADMLHLDWTSQARRELGVPVLHMLEQAED